VDSDVVADHRVRMLDILEDEEAVIRVRTKFHISLVFSACTIELFEKDGVVYTRQEHRAPLEDDIQSEGEREYPGDAETQELLGDSQDTQHVQDAIAAAHEEALASIGGGIANAHLDVLGVISERTQSRYSFATPEDPQEVLDMAGGGFMHVNEAYAASLEREPFNLGAISRELDAEYHYLSTGGTQVEYTQIEDPQSPWQEFEETQIM
jgi:hypothetical protein